MLGSLLIRGCSRVLIILSSLQAWCSILIHFQPFYIGGLDSVSGTENSALGAMFTFIGVFVLSLGGMYYDANYKKEPAPEDDGTANGAEGYQLSKGDVPTYGTSS
eukprot:CAMPEP_0116855502 /NCGR_PEP_ID=MMETSP0418-20121206/19320_1 /TAXON_ID=1158023 /ORGANISM="Astrosyne radiata, Strain 13vi08-1A" /LENGTH=104 /DNA_ID=CAMNT_0004488655 /DNA_START=229 /DNA_END=543 /DNA_ORIENTATION=+